MIPLRILAFNKVMKHLLRLIKRNPDVIVLTLRCLHLLNQLDDIGVQMSVLVQQALGLAKAALTAGAVGVSVGFEGLVLVGHGCVLVVVALLEKSFHIASFVINLIND